ncbi:MAG: AAA family ATPase [Gallionella sp.]
MTLDIKKEFEDIRKLYSEDAMQKHFAALVYGGSGSGKTRLLKTCRRPIHIDSFDPQGTVTIRDEIKAGWVLADTRWENEDPWKPTSFKKWDTEYERRQRDGYFQHIGTYAIDSATTWASAAMNQVLLTAKGGSRAGTQPWENDYLPAMYMIENAIKDFLTLPCDIVLLAHENTLKDDVTGKLYVTPLFVGKLQQKIPLLFTELYYAQTTRTSAGIKYSLLTQSDGTFRARTRLGKEGLFIQAEEPDIKMLLKKAGYPTDDKPY